MDDNNDLYEGYNDFNSALDTENLTYDTNFQQAVAKTSHGRRPPPTGFQRGAFIKPALGRGAQPAPGTAMKRLGTAIGGSGGTAARPMTAVSGAGYSSKPSLPGAEGGVVLEPKIETEEDKIKQLERNVTRLAEESCIAVEEGGDKQGAMEKAKEAYKKERLLAKQREEKSVGEQTNPELSGFVLLNVACQYANVGNYTEALNIYNILTKNKIFPLPGRLRTNVGNVHFAQRAYLKAIKMYRMALDQIPGVNQDLKMRIHRNIALCFIQMGQYTDAAQNYEMILKEKPDLRTGFNLLLCYFALGDRARMKQCFIELLKIPLYIPDDDYYQSHPSDKQANLVLEVIRDDKLRRYERKKRRLIEHCIVTSVKLIAPAIESDFSTGYEWCIDQVKGSPYVELAHDLEIQKAIVYLKDKNFNMAIETLKDFEKRDVKVASSAATNLSFLYYLENDLANAHKYADLSLRADKYNPSALTNKANCYFAERDYEKAKRYYEDALKIDASCIESLYNLGLTYMRINMHDQALDHFFKLHAMQRNNTQVYCKIAECHEKKSDYDQAESWYMQALSAHPKDSELLKRIGNIHDEQGDRSQAFQYYHDAYRYDPSNLNTIEWLGSYYIDSQYPEKAVEYFEKAALGRPNQVKWQLLVANCYRRSGNYAAALEKYKAIHYKFPENTECLKFLVRICTDLGMPEAQEYANQLKKAEKMAEVQTKRISSSDKRKNIIKGRRNTIDGRKTLAPPLDKTKGEEYDTPLLEHQESRDTGSRGGLASREGGRGRQVDLSNADDEPIIEKRLGTAEKVEHHDYLGYTDRPKTAVKKVHAKGPEFDDDAAALLPD